MIMTVSGKETPANSVPAAAVIRRGLALFGITGRKAYVGGLVIPNNATPLRITAAAGTELAGVSFPATVIIFTGERALRP